MKLFKKKLNQEQECVDKVLNADDEQQMLHQILNIVNNTNQTYFGYLDVYYKLINYLKIKNSLECHHKRKTDRPIGKFDRPLRRDAKIIRVDHAYNIYRPCNIKNTEYGFYNIDHNIDIRDDYYVENLIYELLMESDEIRYIELGNRLEVAAHTPLLSWIYFTCTINLTPGEPPAESIRYRVAGISHKSYISSNLSYFREKIIETCF